MISLPRDRQLFAQITKSLALTERKVKKRGHEKVVSSFKAGRLLVRCRLEVRREPGPGSGGFRSKFRPVGSTREKLLQMH